MQKVDLNQLSREHVQATEALPHVRRKLGEHYVEQCARCMREWPCEIRQLITMVQDLHSDLEEAEDKLAAYMEWVAENAPERADAR